ncbi:hypothetical protein J1605_015432 [Eschrichtius robustus]|uniref:Uncharacterized protein n=1 Tax=Eschrichtius robustus TaxID=9764 RepID=A0AB34G9L7_ESCRO|nr:hypothetical protein J1605_015432 [Eschrichtius robustus]
MKTIRKKSALFPFISIPFLSVLTVLYLEIWARRPFVRKHSYGAPGAALASEPASPQFRNVKTKSNSALPSPNFIPNAPVWTLLPTARVPDAATDRAPRRHEAAFVAKVCEVSRIGGVGNFTRAKKDCCAGSWDASVTVLVCLKAEN